MPISSFSAGVDLQAERPMAIVMCGIVEAPRRHVELPELLLEAHAREEIPDPLLRRLAGIAIGLGLRTGYRRAQRDQRSDAEHGCEIDASFHVVDIVGFHVGRQCEGVRIVDPRGGCVAVRATVCY